MHFITVVNKEHPGLELWKYSLEKLNIKPTVLFAPKHSLGHAKSEEKGWFGQKFITLHAYLETLSNTDLCCVTDGFDVFFLEDPTLDLTEFSIQNPNTLLFASELYESPDKKRPYKNIQDKKFNYLNSGVYFGSVLNIKKSLEEALQSKNILELDDQRYFTTYYLTKQNPNIQLDLEAKYFLCLAGIDDPSLSKYTYKSQSLQIDETITKPKILHFQGYYKNTKLLLDLYPNDFKIHSLALKIHRQKTVLTPLGDFLVTVGKEFPFGDKNPFLVGVCIFVILFISILYFIIKQIYI